MRNQLTICEALEAYKGNTYQKHLCSRIVLPHHYKNTYINIRGLSDQNNFAHTVSLTPHALKSALTKSNICAISKQNSKRLKPVNHGPRGHRYFYLLFDEKNFKNGQNSRYTVTLKLTPIKGLHISP
jgi:endo-1,4-beta-D-glucanase Y